MNPKVKWGILSTAKIGEEYVIPALQKGQFSAVTAIASRNADSAAHMARRFDIPSSHGSYDALLSDANVEAVYIPLPNHMHAEWAIKAMNAGKHVLCEKPLALSIADGRAMIAARDVNGVKAGEAFMVNSHPQWPHVKQMIQNGAVGKVTAIQGFFSYINKAPEDIRNIAEYGGGGLWDIGCYQIHCTRFLMGQEPQRVMALAKFDPVFNTDVVASAIMDFDDIVASFTVGTQTMHSQHLTIYGEKAKLQIEIPFNAPIDRETTAVLGREALMQQAGEVIRFPTINQYGAQADDFSRAILEDTDVPVPLEDSLNNTAVILAAFESAKSGKSIAPVDLLQR